ncbi:MAG: hypothetical protein WKG01_15550 [Kofleriaceae bacterium]
MKQTIAGVIVVALGLALSLQTALAQPKPAPPAPTPGSGSDTGATGTAEKAGTDENLQAGGADRPWAAGVTPERQRIAYQAFREGNGSLNDGLFKEAVDRYRVALTSWDHPAIHYNMALALLNLDQPIEVYLSLEKAIKFGAAPLEKDKYEHAREYMLLVAKQLAEVDVSCNKLGAKVSIDGKEVFTVTEGGTNRYVARVRIGKHTFIAQKTGYNAQIDAPFIEPGQKFRIELTLYTEEELTRFRRKWDQRWLPLAVIGGGVAIGLAGGALEVSARSSYRDFDSAIAKCAAESGTGGCDDASSFADKRDSGDTKRTLGFIGYGLAGAAIITGGVMLYLNRETSYKITADEYRRERSSPVSVTPLVAPGLAGAIVRGQF